MIAFDRSRSGPLRKRGRQLGEGHPGVGPGRIPAGGGGGGGGGGGAHEGEHPLCSRGPTSGDSIPCSPTTAFSQRGPVSAAQLRGRRATSGVVEEVDHPKEQKNKNGNGGPVFTTVRRATTSSATVSRRSTTAWMPSSCFDHTALKQRGAVSTRTWGQSNRLVLSP